MQVFNNSITTIPWDLSEYDPDGIMGAVAGSGATDFTIQKDGSYAGILGVRMDATWASGRSQVTLRKNDVAFSAGEMAPEQATGLWMISLPGADRMVRGDIVTCTIYQTVGSEQALVVASNYSPRFVLWRIG
jgi:hypothetical protein